MCKWIASGAQTLDGKIGPNKGEIHACKNHIGSSRHWNDRAAYSGLRGTHRAAVRHSRSRNDRGQPAGAGVSPAPSLASSPLASPSTAIAAAFATAICTGGGTVITFATDIGTAAAIGIERPTRTTIALSFSSSRLARERRLFFSIPTPPAPPACTAHASAHESARAAAPQTRRCPTTGRSRRRWRQAPRERPSHNCLQNRRSKN